jgi:transposase
MPLQLTFQSSDPTWDVAKIWERLDERFGAPEMVEAAIKERLSSFPRIGNKDNKKLYELVDIMIEIESLMEILLSLRAFLNLVLANELVNLSPLME